MIKYNDDETLMTVDVGMMATVSHLTQIRGMHKPDALKTKDVINL